MLFALLLAAQQCRAANLMWLLWLHSSCHQPTAISGLLDMLHYLFCAVCVSDHMHVCWCPPMQQIVRLAREADKEGSRTIGVLTKADTIEAETHDRWLPIMKNEMYSLRLGYFVVVNPSQVGAYLWQQ